MLSSLPSHCSGVVMLSKLRSLPACLHVEEPDNTLELVFGNLSACRQTLFFTQVRGGKSCLGDPEEGWESTGQVADDWKWGRGAYLDTQQSCCKVSALAMAHYTGCCRRRTHRNECDSASPPHMWENTHSTLTTPHLKLSLLRRKERVKEEDRGEKGGKGKERAITNYHAGRSLCGQKRGRAVIR